VSGQLSLLALAKPASRTSTPGRDEHIPLAGLDRMEGHPGGLQATYEQYAVTVVPGTWSSPSI
jgi:hypothetical protein